ncbi:SIMPL domain-containing protein, partial [Patescibacteria group bacterium]|nr:SIMPL domain-containing protein [Patescibacteria group bacterium]
MDEGRIHHHKPKYFFPLFGLFMIILIIFLGAEARNAFRRYAYIGKSEQTPYTITISGEGKVTAIPDIATFSIGVISEDKEVMPAQTENTEKMNAIIDELKKLGVEAEDMKTTQYNIRPAYDWTSSRGQVLRGYQVSQTVTVKIRDLDKVGEIIGKAGTLGANDVSGLTFTIDEPEKLRQQAREEALLAAKKK